MSKLPSLETNDDGLPMREGGGEWTYGKLYYLNAYFGRFIVSMRRKKWRTINYIDLFAGPGKNRLLDGRVIISSPLLALSQKQHFDRYFFADINPVYIDALDQRCSNSPEYSKISFYTGDANQLVDQIIKEVHEIDATYIQETWTSLNLAFLDPEGLELHWNTIKKLASLRTDLIIYYPQMGITRNAPKEINHQPTTSIDEFFGDTTWRDIYHQYQRREEAFLHRALLDHYKEKLVQLGYDAEDPLPEPLFKNIREAPLYRLLFASKHPLGNKFWNDVTKNLPDGQMRLM